MVKHRVEVSDFTSASSTVLASAFSHCWVWFSGRSLFGSRGSCPPFGDASANPTPASLEDEVWGREFFEPETVLARVSQLIARCHNH
jgi:hypothetical protein